MKKILSVLVLVSMVLVFVNSAVAKAPPKPPADCGKDADHDGWCVADPDRNDKLVGVEDCNDADPKVNPGATEILDDGIDQDCDGEDLEAPKFIKNFGCSTAACVKRVTAEIEACEADAEHCAVDKSAGKLVPSWGWYLIDSDCDGTKELLDQTKKDEYDLKVKQGFHCVSERSHGGGAKKAGSGSTGSGGTSGKPAETKSDPKLGELEGRVNDLSDGVALLGGQVGGFVSELDGFDNDLDALDKALATETRERMQSDEGLVERLNNQSKILMDHSGRIVIVEGATEYSRVTASNALESATAAHSTGVSAGLDVGFALIGQGDVGVKGGSVARPGLAPTILMGGHVGAELQSGLYRAFGAVGVPYEEAPEGQTENGLVLTAGLESLFKLSSGSSHSVGPIVRFLDHESGGDVLGVNAKSRGCTGGVAYEFDPQFGSFRVPIHVSAEIGAEQVGTQGHEDGDSFKAISVLPVGMLAITFGAGTGSAIR